MAAALRPIGHKEDKMILNEEYRIIIPNDADDLNRLGAKELAEYLGKAGMKKPAIYTDREPDMEYELCLGPVNREGLPCTKDLKNDGYILRTVGKKIFMVGHNARANLYAAFGFLEEILGYRFYTNEVEKIPRTPLSFDAFDMIRQSPFEFRETSWFDMTRKGIDYRRGLNAYHPHGTNPGRNDVYMKNAAIHYSSFGHSMYDYCNPAEFFDTHPEYFSMVDGVRIRQNPQLCMTNPDVIAIVSKRLRQAIIDHPECQVFSLSQMDWYNPCQCPECARVDSEEGSHAGTLIRFVNACANSIAKEFPHVMIDTFAYQFTRQAPKLTRCAPNVSVRICDIECCFTHPLADCNRLMDPFAGLTDPGVTFQKDLQDWSRMCDHLYVWDYTTNFRFYLAPMINLHLLQKNVQFFVKNNAKGLFEQGNSQGFSGEFGELRGYLLTKLMWEPDGDYDGWMRDFLDGFYGAGGKYIYEYIQTICDHVTKYDLHGGIYENPQHLIPRGMLPQLKALWDKAEAAVAYDEGALERVKKSRLQIRYVELHYGLADGYAAAARKMCEDIRHHKLTFIQEGADLDRSLAQLKSGDMPDTMKTFFRGRDPQ